MRELAVLNCQQLVTLAGVAAPRSGVAMADVAVIADGAMLVRDGRIAAVGTTSAIETMITSDTEVVDARNFIVLPGFVDAHTHPIFAGNRVDEFALRASGAGYAEIAAGGGGIQATVAKTRSASEEELFLLAQQRAMCFLRHGTTTIEGKSGYGLSLESEVTQLRVLARLDRETPLRVRPTFLGAHAFPPEYADDHASYSELLVEQMLPQIAYDRLARWCDIFVEDRYFNVSESRRILEVAKRLGMGLRMHVDQLSDGGGAALAAELGAKTADHLEHADPSAFPALQRAGVIPVLLPASVFCLGLSKYPDARGMIEAGLPVVLASDFNPGSSPTLSMPFVLTLACTQMKMSPYEALTGATINAAYSLDLGGEVGSLEVGKQADFTIWDCRDWREIPYWAASILPKQVFVSGALVVEQGIERLD